MSEKSVRRLRLTMGIVLSVLLIAVGILFALSCYLIYKSGDSPFSPESVGAHFRRIAVPVWLCVAAVIGCGIGESLLPQEQKKCKAVLFPEELLARLRRRDAYPAATVARIKKEEALRRGLKLATALVWVGCTLLALIYLLNSANFPNQDLTAEVLAAALLSLPLFVIAIAFSTLMSLLIDASAKREIKLLRAPMESGEEDTPLLPLDEKENALLAKWRTFKEKNGDTVTLALRIALPVLALVLLLLGIAGGDVGDVLAKAIAICTECIGLG